MRVLFIDDSEDSLTLYKVYLKKEKDIEVVTVNNGCDGIEIFNNEDFDITFVDIQMPDVDGFEVIENIRENPKFNNVFALTGFSDDDTIEKISESGFDGHLGKPIMKVDLIKVIREVVSA
jgi:CheY-like chemotaxis protein